MRTEGGAAGREETLPCLSWTWLLGWLLKKSLSPHSGKKLRHFLPGDAEPTTFEESTGRKLTVVNQSKNCQQRKTCGREKNSGNEGNSIWRNTNMYSFYFLISLTCPLQTCRYLWSEYCLDATPERLFILTRLNLCVKRIVWEQKSHYAVNKILSFSYHILSALKFQVIKVDSNYKYCVWCGKMD